MKEMSLSYSEAFHFLEFRHGPMSMVDHESLIVGFTNRSTFLYELPVFNDMKKLGQKSGGWKQCRESKQHRLSL